MFEKVTFAKIQIPLLLTFLAGISTGLGSLIAIFIKNPKQSYLQFCLGLSAGVMIYVSFVELLDSAIKSVGFLNANLSFFAGVIFIMAIDFLIPHEYIEEHTGKNVKEPKMMTAGIFIALGITIHNFPEGLAVFMSSLGSVKLGIALAFAIAIHNIPEGIAVSMPIFYATKSKSKAFWFSLLSGIAEPIGAIIGILILLPILTPALLSYSLAFVAGIMVFISFDELLPLCYKEENEHIAIMGIISGAFIMALSLYLLNR